MAAPDCPLLAGAGASAAAAAEAVSAALAPDQLCLHGIWEFRAFILTMRLGSSMQHEKESLGH